MEMRIQLKVCEGCGCLWYRCQGEPRVYCAGCDKRLKEFPTAESRKRRGRPRKARLTTVLAVESKDMFDFNEANVDGTCSDSFDEAVCSGFRDDSDSLHSFNLHLSSSRIASVFSMSTAGGAR